VITIVTNPQTRSSSATGVLMDEIERVQTWELSDEELSRAKAALTRQYMEQSDTVSGQAGALGFYEMISDYKFAVNYLDLITSVTADDVKRVANKYLSRTSYVQVIAEPQTRPKSEPGDAPGSANAVTASVRLRVP
jgi:predicted Zn-dependent peptidase